MSILKTLGTGQGWLKAALFGWAGTGKTFTAMILAILARKYFGLTGPVVMVDTEGGSEYIAAKVKRETGMELVGVRTRAFSDTLAAGEEALKMGNVVFVVDSLTHVWEEVCESHLSQVNANLKRRNQPPRTKLEFQDMAELKRVWAKWTAFFLNSPMHIVVAGRAATIWGFEVNEETGKKELMKEGVKMRAEGEFTYEPSLVVEMAREQVSDGKGQGHFEWKRKATVMKDRFGVIDGSSCYDPGPEFFLPHLKLLVPGAYAPVDTSLKTDTGASQEGDTEWARERRQRAIFAEEIQGELVNAFPGQTAEEKKRKTELVFM